MRAYRQSSATVLIVATAVAAIAVASGACQSGGGSSSSSASSGDGGCPTTGAPEALYILNITASATPLPADTTLVVKWSAGSEPAFVLGDPQTWLTLANGANVVCDVPPGGPPPTDAQSLRCELWTSGATEVEVSASGYQSYQQTLLPSVPDGCEKPVPSDVQIELEPSQDGGAPG